MQPAAAVEWIQFHSSAAFDLPVLGACKPESAAVISLKLTSRSVSPV